VKKVLKRFNMAYAKPVNVPLGGHFKLSEAQTPTTEDEKALMSEVPYASVVGSLMYVVTRPDIAQAVGVISRYISNPGKALESCEVNPEISKGKLRFVL